VPHQKSRTVAQAIHLRLVEPMLVSAVGRPRPCCTRDMTLIRAVALGADLLALYIGAITYEKSLQPSEEWTPERMGEFVAQIADELGLGQPHAVGPDIGTGALLFAAAQHPRAFRSLIVGAGAATFPLHVDGALKAFVEAASIDEFREADPGAIIRGAISSIRNYDVPDAVSDDYIESYSGERFLDSIAYVRNYPADLADLSPLLGSISTPVQIIVGRDDPYGLAADGKLLHEQLPHSRLDIFDCGHNAWEEEPDQYSSVVSSWIEGGFAST